MIGGWITIALADRIFWLHIGRFMNGLAIGCVSTSIQVIIAEAMEPLYRDFMMGIPFVAYNLGIALTYQMGIYLNWRMVAWLCIIMPAMSVVLLTLVPESPMWLVQKGHDTDAMKVLTKLRSSESMAKAEMKILVARRENALSGMQHKSNLCQLMCKRNVIKALTVTYTYRVFVIVSGALIFVFYMPFLLGRICTETDCTAMGVYASYVRFIFATLCCLLLYYIGRRTFIISTSLFAGGFLSVLVIYRLIRGPHQQDHVDVYVTSLCLIGYCGMSASFMLMTGVMAGELMPSNIRGRLGGYNSAVFNFLAFVVSKVFPSFVNAIGIEYTVSVFGGGCFCIALTMFLIMPETKKKPLTEIEDYFVDEKWLWMNRSTKKKKSNSRDL